MTQLWVEASLRVIEALEALNIPYVVGGSVASIFYGIVRTTVDTDLVVDLKRQHVESLALALEGEFYLDRNSMYEAINRQSSFNLIHQPSMFKVDVFVPPDQSIGRVRAQDSESHRSRTRAQRLDIERRRHYSREAGLVQTGRGNF